MHVELGGYHVRDLVPVVAFDVDQTKVGTDLGKAIHAGQTTRSASPRSASSASPCSAGRPSTGSGTTTAR